ncbi:MAG TPA: hypothetical protein VFZ14_05735 [Burkholderiales bacterium]|nr:hypothetical protein [Burkholderiales bacterium]
MRRGLVCLVLALWPSVVLAAEPLTLLLIHIIRSQIESAIEETIEKAQRERERPVLVIPPAPYDLSDEKLRALIDEGFIHLTRAQRDEVFESVRRMLSDPKNAALRPMLVQELAVKASAVRQAHERLSALSASEKKALAVQAREEYEKLPVEERQQMVRVLQSGIAPLPHDLNEMILAEFSSVPALPAPAAAATR